MPSEKEVFHAFQSKWTTEKHDWIKKLQSWDLMQLINLLDLLLMEKDEANEVVNREMQIAIIDIMKNQKADATSYVFDK